MVAWTQLQELIALADPAKVASALRGLDDEQRRLLARPVQEYERELRANPRWRWREQPALAVAGAAVLPGASALTPWLARNAIMWWDHGRQIDPTSAVLEVLRDRAAPWLPDLTNRLAQRLPRGRGEDARWQLVAELVSLTGIEPPLTDGYVIHWARDHPWGTTVVRDIRLDPRLAALIPRLFDIDEVAAGFEWHHVHAGVGWPAVFAALAAEGLVDRALLVDCCLAGLQRSGRLSALRWLLAVHDALDLDFAEIGTHAADYLTLLPAAHSTVAGAAQRQLRRLDEAGMLEAATVREASDAMLLRPEKVLVRAQLDWLDKAATRDLGHAAELMLTAAAAFGHGTADLQARALTVVLRHCAGLSPDETAELAAAAAALPPDLRTRAIEALGPVPSANGAAAPGPGGLADGFSVARHVPSSGHGAAVASGRHEPTPALVPPAPELMPLPVGSVEELAAEISALIAGLPDRLDPVSLERVLAGLVAFSYADRSALTAALLPVLSRHAWIQPGPPRRRREEFWVVYGGLDLIIGAAVAHAEGPANRHLPGYPAYGGRKELPGPYAGLMARQYEIAVGVAYAPRPLLMSAPTMTTGLIDPGELLSRLRRAASEGWEPWPIDLLQALLRLPRDPDPAIAAQAASLGTPAGMALARQLSAGAQDPHVTAEYRLLPPLTLTNPPFVTNEKLFFATVRSGAPGLSAGSNDEPSDSCSLAGELAEPERWIEGSLFHGSARVAYQTGWLSCWPMLLPSHRDVIAAHLVPLLMMRVGQGRGGGGMLAALARADGPAGPGMHLALGYGLAARAEGDRAAAADALITLAVRGQLDGEAFETQLGVLVAREDVPLSRVIPGLRELARAGAHGPAWSLVAAMLPQILPPAVSQPPPRAVDLIALGVEAAQAISPMATLECLDQLAARRGSSQTIVQARRLRDTLAAARP